MCFDNKKFRCGKERVHSEYKIHPFKNRKKGGFEIMKNFKRVISAVIALAMSASALVAVNAATITYDDMPETSTYSEAVNALTSLGALHGYNEDGKVLFKPSGEITRAEAVTMIVGGVNLTKDAEAAKSSDCKFADVLEQADWAKGYVNVGVARGFINGFDDGTFKPQEKVTYAQMCVMLTLINGYGDQAVKAGGYPDGYIKMANQSKISEGVVTDANTNLKRDQVAKMLYNAIKVCKLGVVEYSPDGDVYSVLNGSDKAGGKFSTVLSDEFGGYVVKATIDATSRKDSSIDAGKARIKIESADWWDGAEIKSSDPSVTEIVILDDISVDEYLYQSGTAILVIDDLDDVHLVYFVPNNKVETKTVKADDYTSVGDGGKSFATNKQITFGTKDYPVNVNTELVINGFEDTETLDDTRLADVFEIAHGDVTLIDSEETKGYEYILVNVYDVAKVISITTSKDATTIQVTKVKGINGNINRIKIDKADVEDGDVVLTVKDDKGADIDLTNIKKDDIIAFAIKPTTSNAWENEGYIDIIVTNEQITGKATMKDPTDETYTVDGKEYGLTKWDENLMNIPDTYTLILDPFGRIYDAELAQSSAKFAIVEKYDSDYGFQLVSGNGSYKYYETASGCSYKINNVTKTLSEVNSYLNTNKAKPTMRVAEYVVKSSTGEITSLSIVGGEVLTDVEYKERTGKLGSDTITDGTAVIDASEYVDGDRKVTEYANFAVTSFTDKTKYDYRAFKPSDGGSTTAAFVVLTKVGTALTADSRFAVVRKTPTSTTSEDGDEVWSVNVLYEGIEQDILFEKKGSTLDLEMGDAFFFKKGSDGLITDYEKVFVYADYTNKLDADSTPTTPFKHLSNTGAMTYDGTAWGFDLYKASTDTEVQLVYGIITDVTNRAIEFAKIDAGDTINCNDEITAAADPGITTFGIDTDCVAYKFGLSEGTAKRKYEALYVTSADGVVPSAIDAYETGRNTDIYTLTDGDGLGYSYLTYALAMVVDGDVVAIYAINQ
jgi:hypothetical protein